MNSCRRSAAKKEGSDDEECEKKVKVKEGDDDSDSECDGQRKAKEEMDDMVRKVRFNLENLGLVILLVADLRIEVSLYGQNPAQDRTCSSRTLLEGQEFNIRFWPRLDLTLLNDVQNAIPISQQLEFIWPVC